MYTNAQKLSASETQELRREAGKLLKHLREKAGHSQRTFSAEIGSPLYTFVSQVETGRGRVPPDQIRVWANAYGLEAREFLLMIMRFYDPETFSVLFESEPEIFTGTAFPDLSATPEVGEPASTESSP
ncbi:helix-turn-helix transcriptional regulator [Methylobacterium sp. WL120]|uniref:helix-turn-helix domain-containing protein n=1 Tax=Methylobacterium sp. WL120 TaxID=2603887 RepID=UPI0011C7A519|nr:helix-turn-helix transcriptional regulator [Methylobacterium sp. WL120]TXM61527.1 helix-turn-helix transcriptional regulator [Methylobacterium sp. WL120]